MATSTDANATNSTNAFLCTALATDRRTGRVGAHFKRIGADTEGCGIRTIDAI